MLEPDKINLAINPDAMLRTHIKPGDVVVLDHTNRRLKILRPDKEKRFIPLTFQMFLKGSSMKEGEYIQLPSEGAELMDFLNFLLSITNLSAEKVYDLNMNKDYIFSKDEEHFLLDEYPEDKYHG